MIPTADIGLLDGFERALLNGRLRLAYQPKVALDDGRLTRVEALVRWDDPVLGPVPPSRFVPLAERHGLIDALTMWGLDRALKQWTVWKQLGLDISIAFNISALSLENLEFPDLIERQCVERGVPPDRLLLELTEGETQPLIKLMDTLTRFRIKGIGLAIDDFGVGYSSLMQLRQLPFTELKIDRFFVSDLPASSESRLIVKSIIDLAHGLGLTVTAEGIEDAAQMGVLARLGCDTAQGYFIAHPMPPEALVAWNEAWRKRWPRLALGADRPTAG